MKIDDTNSYIIGIIDSHGAVHSTVSTYEEELTHGAVYPSNIFKRWNWWGHRGVEASVISSKFDDEDYGKIERHLKRKYNIKL